MKIKTFVVNPFCVNAYVISNNLNEAILIDPSVSNIQEKKKLQKYIDENHLDIKYLLNTHLHLDHVLGNSFIEQTYKIKALAHEEDSFLLDLQEEQSQLFGLPIEDIAGELGGFIAQDDIIEIAHLKINVIHVAGHSPGGVAFYVESSSKEELFNPILFSGDILFSGSIGRSDLFYGNEQELINGIKNKLLTLPENTIVYPGHGPSTTIKKEKLWF